MKKIYLLALAMGLTGMTSCNNKAQQEAESTQAPQEETTLKVAYVEIDTLMSQYQFCKDYTELANIEGENIQRTLAGKQRTLEQHAAAMQKKYESNGFTSQEELNRAQQSLQAEQQALQELSERLYASFQEEQSKYNEEMRDSVQKFLKEVSLLNQPFVKNDKQSVGQMLKEKNTVVKSYKLYVVGEGIEKKSDDFAAEVAAQMAAAKA